MDKTSLLIKNLPDNIRDINEFFKNHYGAVKAKSYGRRRAIVKFSDENTAKEVLYKLHQNEMEDRILSVEYVFKQKSLNQCDNHKQEEETLQQNFEQNTSNENQKISNFLRLLYGINPSLDFDQPPPPYLKYYYPKINRNILDSISIALLTVPKFYVQVLHLMNRMNLDPPFLPLQKPFNPPGELINVQTQTDNYSNENYVNLLLSDDESELESDSDENQIKIQNIKSSTRKRKGSSFDHDLILKKKVKKLIEQNIKISELKQSNSALNKSQVKNLNEIFEKDLKIMKSQKIEMNVTNVKLPERNNDLQSNTKKQDVNNTDDNENKNLKTITDEDLKFNRIPENQLKELPVFRNYQKGEKSNKLYIKNLSKDVTVEDLKTIYNRFVSATINDLTTEKIENNAIHIKLMQHGKMKGQAFVTFTGLNDNNDTVEKALNETNGYILKKKPMIVCFGKQS